MLSCGPLTALVGPNGSGKSSFIRALELFYATTPRFGPEDFYAEDTEHDIEITVTFADLASEERDRFAKYVEGDALSVTRVLSWTNDKGLASYHGSRPRNPEFASVRGVSGAAARKTAYEGLRQATSYAALPKWTKQDDALAALEAWEESNEALCQHQRDDGQFFGFGEVAKGYLGRYTRFIAIPAVRDAAQDAAEGRGSPITEIMDLVVRSVLANREEITRLKEETQKKYDEIMSPERLTELGALQDRLTRTLRGYVPDAGVQLSWSREGSIEISMPRADVKLVEDGFPSSVIRTGHGLQRAFILTMLQHLTLARISEHSSSGADESEGDKKPDGQAGMPMPNLVLGIEEPELYQHPNRQRHLSRILRDLAMGAVPGVAGRTQVIYGTHSPLFVGIDRLDQVRLLRKNPSPDGGPKITNVVSTTLDEIAEGIWEALGRPDPKFTGETLRPRLQAIMTPWMNEGFFADVVVLVEGEGDRAAILGVAKSVGHELESSSFAVIPCMGKTNLDRPLEIFRRLGIPTYVLWDSDYGAEDAKPEVNRYLLRLCGCQEEDWPEVVADRWACFKTRLERRIEEDIGTSDFERLLKAVQEECGISKKDQALKNASVIERLLVRARASGKDSPILERIVERIVALKPTPVTA